jgi:hypothetical protein
MRWLGRLAIATIVKNVVLSSARLAAPADDAYVFGRRRNSAGHGPVGSTDPA